MGEIVVGGAVDVLELDAQGNLVLNGTVVALAHSPETIERATRCVSGRVLEGGLGLGQTRQALLAASAVLSVETVEIEPAVAGWDGAGARDVVDVEAETKPQFLVTGDVRAVVATAVGLDDRRWDSALIDLGEDTDAYEDPQFLADLKVLFPNFGARIVMIRQRNDVAIPGFVLAAAEQQEDLSYVLVFDRYDPAEGVGTLDTRGSMYLPGFGWQP